MKRSSKIFITVVAVAAISAASLSYVSAGGRYGGCGNGPGGMQGQPFSEMGRHGFSHRQSGNRSEMMLQKLDMVKYQLRITEDQEPAWQAFEQAIKSKMEVRKAHFNQHGSGQAMTIEQRIGQMRQGSAHMAELATQMEKLYAELTPEQQKIADTLGPMGKRRMF